MDYKNGKIYSIRSYQSNDVYYGSTCQPLTKRLSKHKANYNQWIKDKNNSYVTSFGILKYNDNYIELVEIYPCESKMELEKREGEIIRQNNNAINKVIPGRKYEEYFEANKDKINLQRKEYRQNNLEKLKFRDQEYRKNNTEKIKLKQRKYIENNIEKVKLNHQKYNYDNKDIIKIQKHKYYIETKEKNETTRQSNIINEMKNYINNKKINQLYMINKMWLDFQ